MTQVVIELDDDENQLITKASTLDKRSKRNFVTKYALERAKNLVDILEENKNE